MLSEDALRGYQKAGRIAADVRGEARSFVEEGMSLLTICERVEKLILDKGGRLAFPCNVCVNDVAAHYSSPSGDVKRVSEGALVKVDLGVHVDGYIADTATTISFDSEHEGLVRAAKEALEHAIKTLRPGVRASEIGATIQETIERYGFKPIRNLTGHQLDRYVLHTGRSIPNVSRLDGSKIREGEVYAIEPFVTLPSGVGMVREINEVYIFRFQKERRVRNANARRLLGVIKSDFRMLPFSERWIRGVLPREEFDLAFSELLSSKSIAAYPVLVEAGGKVVAQAEHTVVVTKDGCVTTTL